MGNQNPNDPQREGQRPSQGAQQQPPRGNQPNEKGSGKQPNPSQNNPSRNNPSQGGQGQPKSDQNR